MHHSFLDHSVPGRKVPAQHPFDRDRPWAEKAVESGPPAATWIQIHRKFSGTRFSSPTRIKARIAERRGEIYRARIGPLASDKFD